MIRPAESRVHNKHPAKENRYVRDERCETFEGLHQPR